MLPIANGGRYTLANVVPSCPSCNASKCNAEVTTWLRRKKLDERSFLVRQAEIVRSIPVPAQSITLPKYGFGCQRTNCVGVQHHARRQPPRLSCAAWNYSVG
jgi:hypothetical protein